MTYKLLERQRLKKGSLWRITAKCAETYPLMTPLVEYRSLIASYDSTGKRELSVQVRAYSKCRLRPATVFVISYDVFFDWFNEVHQSPPLFKLTRVPLDENNRMLRAGFGKHDGKWFIRVDLWFVGFRLS